MNQDQIDSIVRSACKVAGGILAAHGMVATAAIVNSANVIELIAGIAMAAIASYASHSTHAVPPIGTVKEVVQNEKKETSTTTAAPSTMKTTLIIASILAISFSALAQTNNPPDTGVPNLLGDSATSSLLQQAYDDTIGTSNGVFVATAARKLVGNANRFSLDYIYSFNQNAALVLGFDDIRAGGYSQANVLKGGLTLKADIYPLKNFGVTNFFVTPYTFVLIATPVNGTDNNGGVGQLAGAGVSWEHSFTKNLSLELGCFYENSTGEAQYNGNWTGVLAGVHYKF